MVFVQNTLAVIFVLGVMILVHEMGHFLAAKYFDVRVDAFSFGFGPRLFGRKWGETDYRICALPLGGYVKMAGEQPSDERTNDPREFLSKPRWQRLIVAVMGPVANVLLAISLLVGLFMVRFEQLAIHQQPAVLGDVEPNSPAAKAGLQANDRISAINGKQDPNWEEVTIAVAGNANRTLQIQVTRAGKTFETSLVPTLDPQINIGYAGWAEQVPIQVGEVAVGMPAEKAGLKSGDVLVSVDGLPVRSRHKLPEVLQQRAGQPVTVDYLRDGKQFSASITPIFHQSAQDGAAWRVGVVLQYKYERTVTRLGPAQALRESLDQNSKNATLIFQFLKGILQRRMSPKALEGPIGIARLSGQAARQGFAELIVLMSAISLNLGILNLLPIPILDGGVIVLLLFESLIGRDLSLAIKERIVQAGFVFLMLLIVFVIYNDIMKSLG